METMDFKKIGDLIRKVRKEGRMTLADLADDYIPSTTLSAIERGLTNNPLKIQYILRKLDISLADLSEREKEEAERRNLNLMIIENKINSNARKSLIELSELSSEYESPLLDFLRGRCHFKLKQYDRAVECFNKALKTLDKSIDHEKTNLKPCCLNHISIIEFKRNNNKEKALRYVEEAVKCFYLDGKRRYYYAMLLTNKAIYLRALGRAEDALKTLEEIEVNSFDINIDAAIGIYDLQAKLKLEIKLYDEAASYALKGLELARVNYNNERELELYITLGDIYKESERLEQAEKCLLAAIDLKDKISRRHWLILEAYLKLGIVHFENRDFLLSQKTLQKAVKIAHREKDMLKYSKALLYIAKGFLSENKIKEALANFLEVYEIHSDKKTDLEALLGLSKVYLLLKDEENYAEYSKLLIESLEYLER